MGPYLAKPETTIHTSNDENDRFIYCTAEMQGWRKTQEDAHSALLNYDDKGSAFFAVFDGHGGEEVSKYCALHFPPFLKRSLYADQNIPETIKKSFLEFDRTLKEPHVISQLRKLASLDVEDEVEEDEAALLRKEAQMPIEQLIQSANILGDIIPKADEAKDTKNGETSKGEAEAATTSSTDAGASEDNNKEAEVKKDEDGNEAKAAEVAVKADDDKKELPKEEEKKNGETSAADSSNNGEESNGEGPSSSSAASASTALNQPSSSGASSSPSKKAVLDRASKSMVMKVLNQQIYDAFLNDFESDDDDEEEDEETLGSDSEEDDDDDEDEDEDEDEEDSDDDFNAGPDPFGNAYITPGGGSGCTAIVAIVRGNVLYVANVGDSRCVLSREGTAIELSEDHKPEDEKEKNRIIAAGGEVTSDGRVNGGLNLSRAIGDHLYKKNDKLPDVEQMVTALPDIRTHEIDATKDQFLILACDGIWNSMSSQEVVDFINERMENVELKTICEELFKACLAPNTEGDGSGCDNMTCVLVKFKKNGIEVAKRPLEEEEESGETSADHSKPDQKKAKTSAEEDATIDEDLFKPGGSGSSKS